MTPAAFPDHMKKIQALHAHFESLTGNKCTLSYARITAWDELIKRGYSADDVAKVIRYIRSQMNKQGSGYSPASLQFSRLISDADLFEDRLNLARAAWRKPDDAATSAAPTPPPPAGWSEWVRDAYPTATVPARFADLPWDIQAECRRALES